MPKISDAIKKKKAEAFKKCGDAAINLMLMSHTIIQKTDVVMKKSLMHSGIMIRNMKRRKTTRAEHLL